MNSAMKIDNIKDYMKERNMEFSNNFLYCYAEPGFLSTLTYGAFASLIDMNQMILFFYPDSIVMQGVTAMGNFSESRIEVPREDIEVFEVKKGWIQYKLTLKLKGEKKIKLKANKRIVGAKWQGENIEYLEQHNWFQ